MRLTLKPPSWLHGRTLVAAVIVGAMVHIVVTLTAAHRSARAAFDAVARQLPVNQMKLLPATSAANQLLPFQSPDMRYVVCRFDAGDGSITVKASLPGLGWSLSLHNADGGNFFVVTGQEGRRTELALLLVPQGDEFVPLPREAVGAQSLAQVPITQREGLAIVRGPLTSPAYRAEVEAELAKAACAHRKR
ncbi:MAG: DUF1254 domain-containing protein [Hyphomicrobiaceae bacterium]